MKVAPRFAIVAHREPARLFLDELGGQIQPVAGPVVPRREERLEDAIDERLGDARTIIHDIDDDPPLPLVFRRAGPEHDMAGSVQPRQGLLRIAEQVEQHLHQPAGIDPNSGNIVVAGDFNLDLTTSRMQPLQK